VRIIRRRLFALTAILSLAIAIIVATLWTWSYYTRWSRIEATSRRVIVVPDASFVKIQYRGLLFESGNVIVYRYRDAALEAARESHTWEFNDRVVGRNLRAPGQWLWVASEPGVFGAANAYVEIGVRAWIVVALFAVLPSWWCVTIIGGSRDKRRGLCLKCGYDLRATPQRCPECGHAAAMAQNEVPDASISARESRSIP
jgi:hypothetical protein